MQNPSQVTPQAPPDPSAQIKQKYGSVTNFYREIAKQTGTTPDRVMEEVEKMGNQQMPAQAPNPNMPQTSIGGANAQTPVSQVASGPTSAMQPAVQAQASQLQNSGMAQGQAMNQAASNPANGSPMAKGGPAQKKPAQKPIQAPPTPQEIGKEPMPPEDQVKAVMQAMGSDGQPKVQAQPQQPQPVSGMAKGGPSKNLGNLQLKQIMQLLATHPGLQGDPSPSAQAGSSGYSEGGPVKTDNTEMGLLNMASGGSTSGDSQLFGTGGEGGQNEEDQVTGYGPDGTPIIQNADGTTSYGDIDQMLGRPSSASTLGTGADPSNATSQNAANAPLIGMAMAKGGEDQAPPPGSLPEEIADQVPANLSPGEFVMSADATRFWGLQKLQAMQQFARQELAKQSQTGGIRHPGDGLDAQQGNEGFQQGQPPNHDWYNAQDMGQDDKQDDNSGMAYGGACDAASGGLISRASSPKIKNEGFGNASNPTKTKGVTMAFGGSTDEETQFAKGGAAKGSSYGRDNILSSHPQGGSTSLDYNKGGVATKKRPPQKLASGGNVVSAAMDNPNPIRKSEIDVPTKMSASHIKLTAAPKNPTGPKPHANPYGMGKFGMAKGGGLLRNINQQASTEA